VDATWAFDLDVITEVLVVPDSTYADLVGPDVVLGWVSVLDCSLLEATVNRARRRVLADCGTSGRFDDVLRT